MKITINKNRQIAIILGIAYIFLIIYAILEETGFFGPDIGVLKSLQNSGFTRAMFLDIGILATLVAFWVLLTGKEKYRIFFAFAILFVGSFALLPYLIIEFWKDNISLGNYSKARVKT
ncbi:hypothetical protein KC675_00925 [Candidatus Dojkabacteria bacterium]|jgi:hypothetical protein|uniref:Uncharacterized protein n=1 Tax=Candidatus Dojkabacteria bacterium TaxID=2099670 RepID=A0A955I623_9BACT|nr:hypothetical protein [Candidatus Dojkabacteria bacterium]